MNTIIDGIYYLKNSEIREFTSSSEFETLTFLDNKVIISDNYYQAEYPDIEISLDDCLDTINFWIEEYLAFYEYRKIELPLMYYINSAYIKSKYSLYNMCYSLTKWLDIKIGYSVFDDFLSNNFYNKSKAESILDLIESLYQENSKEFEKEKFIEFNDYFKDERFVISMDSNTTKLVSEWCSKKPLTLRTAQFDTDKFMSDIRNWYQHFTLNYDNLLESSKSE